MSNELCYIARGIPAPVLFKLHDAILAVNKAAWGKKHRFNRLGLVDIPNEYSKEYDGAILFHDWVAREAFRDVIKSADCSSYLNFSSAPYVARRTPIEYRGDGRLAIWRQKGDNYIHLTGEEVNSLPWNISESSGRDVVITDVIIVGSNNGVRNAYRRYIRTHNRINATDKIYSKGMGTQEWKFIVERMFEATIYLVTQDKTLINLTRGDMHWVRPTHMECDKYYTELLLNGYERILADVKLRRYSIPRRATRSNTFEDSIINVALTNTIELVRQ